MVDTLVLGTKGRISVQVQVLLAVVPLSSKGRTLHFHCKNGGSNPPRGTILKYEKLINK